MTLLDDTETQMADTLGAVQRDFGTVRTGKASPAILETVRVEAYGGQMPLNQVATVSSPEGSLLVVQPFDVTLIGDIERAILNADLGLNPANDGAIIRIPVPPLNEERRKEFVKVLHKKSEDGRVSLRHARQKANAVVKDQLKDHDVSEDDGHRLLDRIQKLTDEYSKRLDQLLANKEREVMEI